MTGRRTAMFSLREAAALIPGATVLIYDQTCAAEKRRRRKRGKYPDPPERVFINDAVCEGCGDCSDKSNCIAVLPVETELGGQGLPWSVAMPVQEMMQSANIGLALCGVVRAAQSRPWDIAQSQPQPEPRPVQRSELCLRDPWTSGHPVPVSPSTGRIAGSASRLARPTELA